VSCRSIYIIRPLTFLPSFLPRVIYPFFNLSPRLDTLRPKLYTFFAAIAPPLHSILFLPCTCIYYNRSCFPLSNDKFHLQTRSLDEEVRMGESESYLDRAVVLDWV
jgi:hypothetical protein